MQNNIFNFTFSSYNGKFSTSRLNMKYILSLLLAVSFYVGGQNIVIPDAVFKAYLIEHFDADGDGEISEAEANAVTQMKLSTSDI